MAIELNISMEHSRQYCPMPAINLFLNTEHSELINTDKGR